MISYNPRLWENALTVGRVVFRGVNKHILSLARENSMSSSWQRARVMAASTCTNRTDSLSQCRSIDLRSDTVTRPTLEMRQAMYDAVVGDDVFGDDPTVLELQKTCADLLGKEAGLFVSSGTLGNLISVMVHCTGRAQEIAVGNMSHMLKYEVGGCASIAGVNMRTVTTLTNGTLDLSDLKLKINISDVHLPQTALVCVENTHNLCGGVVLPLDYMDKLSDICTSHEIPIHMDGARLLNAAVALNCSPNRLVKHCQSVTVCLSKGLGAPVGSVICGSRSFIDRALKIRKMLGGGMRQVGVLAAPGLIAIDKGYKRLHEDHENAYRIAKGLVALGSPHISIDLNTVATNMVYITMTSSKWTSSELTQLLSACSEPSDAIHRQVQVHAVDIGNKKLRLVTNHHVEITDVELIVGKFKSILESE